MKKLLLTFCFLASLSMSAQITAGATGIWNNGGTWVGGIVPTAADDVIIDGFTVTIANGNTGNAKSLETKFGASALIIQQGAHLVVVNNITNVKSDNSITILGAGGTVGTMTLGGTITSTKRIALRNELPKDKWYLIASPFINAQAESITANAFSNLKTNGTKVALAVYNDGNAAGSKYTYFDTTTIKPRHRYIRGTGYSIQTTDAGGNIPRYTQQGFYESTATTTFNLTDAGNGYNLISNPYFAYLYANSNTGAANLLSENGGPTGVLDQDTIWFWDGDNGAWVTKNQSSPAYHISPLQGFFVKAKTGGGTLTYRKTMQTITSNGDIYFKSSNNRFEIDLSIASNELNSKTAIRYIDNKTTDFDNGYDSSTFGGYASSFEVYTQLVENNTGKNLAIQSLPNANYENMVIPVGVKATAGSEITFSAEALNVPSGYKVYLEDRTNTIFTRLDEASATYKATLTSASSIGRFFLHTSAKSALSVDTAFLNSVSIYKTSNSNLRLVGFQKGKATISLVNLLGKTVMKSTFQATNSNDISLPRLATGVYIVQLETEAGKLNKKIILE